MRPVHLLMLALPLACAGTGNLGSEAAPDSEAVAVDEAQGSQERTVVLNADTFHKAPTVDPVPPSSRTEQLLSLSVQVPPPSFPRTPDVDVWNDVELVHRMERAGGKVVQQSGGGFLGRSETSVRAKFPGGEDVRAVLVDDLGEPIAGWTRGVYTAAVARGDKQGLFVNVRREDAHRSVAKALKLEPSAIVAAEVDAVAGVLEKGGYRLVVCNAGNFEVSCTGDKQGQLVMLTAYGEQMGEPGVQFIAALMFTDAHRSMELQLAEPAKSLPLLKRLLALPPTPSGYQSPWLD